MGTVPSERCAGQCLVLRVETGLVRLLECLLSITFMGIFALVVLLVVMRYLFNSTVVGGNEATVMLFIYTTALGAAVDVARGKHIIVDTFVNYLPPVARYWLDIFNLVIVGVLNGFLMKYGIDWVTAVGTSEHPVLHIPEGIVQIALPIGCALTILFCFTRIVVMLVSNPNRCE